MIKSAIVLVFFLGVIAVPSSMAQNDLFSGLTSKYENVKVVRIIRSDVVQLDNDKKIRLIGVKGSARPKSTAPVADSQGFEVETRVDPETPLDELAFEFTDDLLDGKKVTVELDQKASDEDGYIWGYIFLPDGSMANEEILRQGYAQLQIRPPNLKYADRLRQAYREAFQEKRGIHSE